MWITRGYGEMRAVIGRRWLFCGAAEGGQRCICDERGPAVCALSSKWTSVGGCDHFFDLLTGGRGGVGPREHGREFVDPGFAFEGENGRDRLSGGAFAGDCLGDTEVSMCECGDLWKVGDAEHLPASLG